MTDADFANPTQESIWRVTRQLKKEQYSLYNCVASILSDAAFVSEVRALYPTTPLLANLRCGLWYTRQPDGTCYFKSTDGHNGNWSFSCTRLNWHVCELAAKQGGVIIVDATRKGKRFPDAMTKTIPIWAAVVNRAVARKRAEASKRLASPFSSPPIAACAQQQCHTALPAAAATVGKAASEGGVVRVGSLSQWLNSSFTAALADWEASTAAASQPGDAPGTSSAPESLGVPFNPNLPPAPTDAVPPAVAPPLCGVVGEAAAASECEQGGTRVEAGVPEVPQQPYQDPVGAIVGQRGSRPQLSPSLRSDDPGAGACELEGRCPLTAPGAAAAADALDEISEGARVGSDGDREGVDLAAASASHVSCSPEESCGRRGICCSLGGDMRGCCSGDCGEGYFELCDLVEGQQEAMEMPMWPPRCTLSEQSLNCRCYAGHLHHHHRHQQEGTKVGDLRDWEQQSNGGRSAFGSAAAAAASSSSSNSSASVASSASLASLASSRSSSEDSCELSVTADASLASLPSAPGSGVQALTCYNSACNLYSKFTIAADGGENTSRPARNGCYATNTYHTVRCSSTGSVCSGGVAARPSATTVASGPAVGCRVGRLDVGAEAAVAACEGDMEWDEGLHLPLWISANERAQIERRLDGWVDSLLRLGADVEGLAKILAKPLRPLWINQSSTIWIDQVAQPDQLPFTPLYLVSASQPQSYLRQACGTHASASGASDIDDVSCSDTEGEFVRQRSATRRGTRRRSSRYPHISEPDSQPHAWTYVYVPGAGDDEESWATGLTPAVFWAHYPKLLRAGPAGIHDAVRKLLQKEALALVQRGANSSVPAAIGSSFTHGSIVAPPPGFGPKAHAAAASLATAGDWAASAGVSAYVARTDEHHLLPAGCRGTAANGAGGGGASCPMASTGLYFLGPTGIALGTMAAGAAPACWQHVDAVLSCGLQPHPSMASEPQRQELAASGTVTVMEGPRCTITSSAAAGRHRHQSHGDGDTDRPDVTAQAVGSAACAGALPRYLHVPVQHYKHSRTSLLQQLSPALSFVSKHLEAGHSVLIHDTNGLDTCVCIAVALLLTCFGPLDGGSVHGQGGNGGATTAVAPEWAGPYRSTPTGTGLTVDGHVSKDAVRQRLAYVSSWYPPARPTRGMLRQVYNHFVHAAGACGEAGVGSGSDAE